MGNIELSSTEVVIALAGALALACYVALILVPAMRCYGRVWEKMAAGVLTLYVLGTLVGMGAALGFLIVWTYDTYAG
jgi:O-antigen ligase